MFFNAIGYLVFDNPFINLRKRVQYTRCSKIRDLVFVGFTLIKCYQWYLRWWFLWVKKLTESFMSLGGIALMQLAFFEFFFIFYLGFWVFSMILSLHSPVCQKYHFVTLRNSTELLLDKFMEFVKFTLNTVITIVCNNLWHNEMTFSFLRYSYQYHIIRKWKEVCPKLIYVASRCHSLSFVAPLVVPFVSICSTRCHSLSLNVNRCQLLYHTFSFVFTRCTIHLLFCKRSN